MSDPLNLCIDRVPRAGTTDGDLVVLHNGHRVPFRGPGAYYDQFSDILIYNRGVHEPLEEFAFQQVLTTMPERPVMFELGSNWAHYSMWLLQTRPLAQTIMVEPGAAERESGIQNFARNGYVGTFVAGAVSRSDLTVDGLMQAQGVNHLSILHADIQGAEGDMLLGARVALGERRINNIFISTHSQTLHDLCTQRLTDVGYRIEISADFDHQTTSFDGLILARNAAVPPLFHDFRPLGRVDICNSNADALCRYVACVRGGPSVPR